MKPNTPLTFSERKTIQSLLKTSLSCSAISRKIGRGKNTVVTEVKKNGGRLEYNAKEAQSRFECEKKARYERLSNFNRGKKSTVLTLKEKVECLEMQVEILAETLKDLINEKNQQL